MSSMSRTFEVSNEERSRDDSDRQPSNMLPIILTFEVSSEDKSRDVSDSQA